MTSPLVIALRTCLSADNNERKNAEQVIINSFTTPTMCIQFLEIACSTTEEETVKLQAAIAAKNMVKRHWRVKPNNYTISDQEKTTIRELLFEITCKATVKPIRKLFLEIITLVGRTDFPDRWESIIESIKKGLLTGSYPITIASLRIICKLITLYKLELGTARNPLETIIGNLFEIMLQILSKCKIESNEEAEVSAIILKSFSISICISISTQLISTEIISQWLDIIVKIACTHHDSSPKSPFWKSKAYALNIAFRLFQKYGDPKIVEKEYISFSQIFASKYNEIIFKAVLTSLQQPNQSSKALAFSIKLLTATIRNPQTYHLIKPFVNQLITGIIVPNLQISNSDAQQWTDSPEEFTRSVFWESLLIPTPKLAAESFVVACCNSDLKEDGHENLLFIIKYFIECLSKNKDDARLIDAIFTGLGNLNELVDSQLKAFHNEIEDMMKTFVAPRLVGDSALLQMRAAWLYGKFHFIVFKDKEAIKQVILCIIKHMINKKAPLPVRVVCAAYLQYFYDVPELKEIFTSSVSQMLEAYIDIIKLIDLEEVVDAIDLYVKQLGDLVKPFALALMKEITETYQKTLNSLKDDENDNEDAYLAASSGLNVIERLVSIVKDEQHLLEQAEQLVLPICWFALRSVMMDMITNSMHILAVIIGNTKTVSPQIWEFYPVILNCLVGTIQEANTKEEVKKEGGWMYENLNSTIVVINNFISKGDEFLAKVNTDGETFFEMLLRLIKRIIEIAKYKNTEIDSIVGVKIISTILECLKGKLNTILPDIIQLLMQEMNNVKLREYGRSIMVAGCMCFYNNVQLSLEIMHQKACFTPFIKALSDSATCFKKLPDIRLIIFGLASILQVIPDHFIEEAKLISNILVILAGKSVEEEEKTEKPQKEEKFTDEDYQKTLKKLENYHKAQEEHEEAKMDDEDSDGDDDDDCDSDFDFGNDEEEENDDLYISPLDGEDDVLYLEKAYKTETGNKWGQLLSPDDIKKLETYILIAKKSHEK